MGQILVGPRGHATVSGAVAHAQDGDTVLVGPGTYAETVTIERAISLIGDGPRESVVIESNVSGPCLVVTASTPRIAALTLRVGEDNWDVVAAVEVREGASPTIEGNDIRGWSAGVRVSGAGTSPVIRGNRVQGVDDWRDTKARALSGNVHDDEDPDDRAVRSAHAAPGHGRRGPARGRAGTAP